MWLSGTGLWNIGSCFLCNCYSVQGQNIEFLPLLNPDITLFDCYKVDFWQPLRFFEIFTHILFFFFFFLEYSWCTALCWSQVYSKMIQLYTSIYIHSFSDSFLILVITEYWVEFAVLCSRSLLVISLIYSSVCMLVPISWHPSPRHFPFGKGKLVFNICKSVSVL